MMRVILPFRLPVLILLMVWGVQARATSPSPLASPEALLLHGRVDEMRRALQPLSTADSGAAHLLLCRAAYAEDQSQTAVDECTRAVTLMPSDGSAQLWLGRALGQEAGHANPLAAYKLAGRVRVAFEKAHALNPQDARTTRDLADFYLQAPGMVGGGAEKAQALASALLAQSPAMGDRLLGLLAENRKDTATAEAEYRREIATDAPAGYIDLALFYQRQKQYEQASAAVSQALAADRLHGPVEVDAASLLTEMKRQPDAVERALRAYLASANQTDEAPVFRAHLLLGRLLQKRGDASGARAEYTSALNLAQGFQPARKALESL